MPEIPDDILSKLPADVASQLLNGLDALARQREERDRRVQEETERLERGARDNWLRLRQAVRHTIGDGPASCLQDRPEVWTADTDEVEPLLLIHGLAPIRMRFVRPTPGIWVRAPHSNLGETYHVALYVGYSDTVHEVKDDIAAAWSLPLALALAWESEQNRLALLAALPPFDPSEQVPI
jgi:hypothetical protein